MSCSIRQYEILPEIKKFVNAVFLVESEDPMLGSGLSTIEPNGSVKLILPIENSIYNANDHAQFVSREGAITFVGMFNTPFAIKVVEQRRLRFLVIELKACGAHRLAKINHQEHVNSFSFFNECYGKPVRELEELIYFQKEIEAKIMLLQNYLRAIFFASKDDNVFDYCIKRIESSYGNIEVKDLEKNTGYSSRWLNVKFRQRLGVSPRLYASIFRFKTLLNYVAEAPGKTTREKIYLDYYYDQSHFIREFKRYSGVTPTEFVALGSAGSHPQTEKRD